MWIQIHSTIHTFFVHIFQNIMHFIHDFYAVLVQFIKHLTISSQFGVISLLLFHRIVCNAYLHILTYFIFHSPVYTSYIDYTLTARSHT